MTVESVVISHIVRSGDEALTALIAGGITIDYFTEERTHAIYGWILNYWADHGHVPEEEPFERRWPRFKLAYVNDPTAALIEELRDNYAQATAAELIPEITVEFAKGLRGDDRFNRPKVMGLMATLQERVSLITSVNDVALFGDKMESYLADLYSMKGTEVPGIPTGFDTLDMASGGWQPENFGVIGAGPKRFKTAILVWMALAAARAGYLCKMVTFEMSIKELMDRTTCLGAQVSYTSILRGNINDKERKRLDVFAKEVADWKGDIEIVHDLSAVTTISGLTVQLRTKRPDILFIDGLYQMIDDSREWTSEAMALTAVSRGLKRLAAAEKIPIVGTTQALLSRISARKGTEMGSLGYTSAFAQDANVLIGIDRPDMSTNAAKVKVIGARTMAGISINVTVDLDTGTIFESGEVGAAEDDDDYGN